MDSPDPERVMLLVLVAQRSRLPGGIDAAALPSGGEPFASLRNGEGTPIIHPSAEVSAESAIGEGTRIWHHAQVRERASIGSGCVLAKGVYVDSDVIIGRNCKLQNGVSVYRPAVLEDGVFLGPAVVITNDRVPRAVNPDGTLKAVGHWQASAVLIRHGAAIGAGSVVLPGVTIGRWAMVGAGAVVLDDLPDHALAVGNPARLLGFVCACGARLDSSHQHGDRTCGRCALPSPPTGGAK